jgi:hypothetical protein
MSGSPSMYCKAVLLKDLQQFTPLECAVEERGVVRDADAIFYIHDNYVVREGIFSGDPAIFDDVDESWKSFCHEKLGFAIPEFLQDAPATQAG